jgi:tetratricopeptide (TPR) repeat protein
MPEDRSFGAALDAIDEATELGDAAQARALLASAGDRWQERVPAALLTVRSAFLPDPDVSLSDLRYAVATIAAAGMPHEAAVGEGALGAIAMTCGHPLEAVAAYGRAAERFTETGDRDSAWRSTLNRAAALISLARYRDALAALTGLETEIAADASLPEAQRRLLTALASSNTAAAELALGKTTAAERSLNRAARLYQELGMPLRAGTVLFNQAFSASSSDRPELAQALYQQAAEVFDSAGDGSAAIAALRGAGTAAARLGRLEDAEAAHIEVLRRVRRTGNRREALRTVIGLSAVRAERDPRAALELLTREVTPDDLRDPALTEEIADSWRNRGVLASRLGDHEDARAAFDEAERLFTGMGLPIRSAEARMGRAVALHDAGQYRRAVAVAREALAAGRASGLSGVGLAHLLTNVAAFTLRAFATEGARASVGRDEAAEALQCALEAVAAVEEYRYSLRHVSHREHVLDGPDRTVYATAVAAARAAEADEDLAAIVEMTRTHAIAERDLTGSRSSPAGNSLREVGDAGGLDSLAAARTLPLRRAAPLVGRAGGRAVGPRGEPVVLADLAVAVGGSGAWWVTTWVDREQVTAAALGPERTEVCQGPLDVDAYLAWLSCLGVVYPVDEEIAQLGRGAPADVAGFRTAAGPLLADPAVLERWGRRLSPSQRDAVLAHPAVTMARHDGEAHLLWRLARTLLPPRLRESLLAGHTPERRPVLAVAPVPAMGRLPWHLLPLLPPQVGEESDVPRLADVADVVHVPPAAFTAGCPPAGHGDGDVLAVVDPLDDLPAARQHAYHGDRVLAGSWLGDPARRATAEAVVAALAERTPRAMVVAAHFDEPAPQDPAESGMVLSGPDGAAVLSARELLSSGVRGPDVVVLLGCESLGVATGSEWTGLALGLLWSGTSRVIGSLWPTLDDEPTTQVENELVRHVLTDPVQGHSRFLAAQLDRWRHRPDDPTSRPYRWAAYAQVRARMDRERT